jgi:predicted RNA-binding Zn ribbon-like protein
MSASSARAPGGDAAIGQAPGDLATLQAFVNTLDIEQGTDELATPASLDGWLRAAGLLASPADPARPRDLATAVDLREALRGILRTHVSHPARQAGGRGRARAGTATAETAGPAAAATERSPAARVADIAATLDARLETDADGRVAVVPAGSGPSSALTRLLLTAAEAATLGTWQRLKVCSADDCQWAFYDRSPTRSGCWCSMQICGSRAKSRAYRNARASRAARTAGPGA